MSGEAALEASTLHLLAWLSPAFPVGAFAYSHGLETAADDGDIHDGASLVAWLSDIVRYGSLHNDAIIAKAAWSATTAADDAALGEINDLALALAPARERRLETGATGTAFAGTIRSSWPESACPLLPDGDIAYPVAYGATCAMRAIPLQACLEAFGFAFVQNLVSAAVRLGPVGQTEGQRTVAALLPAVQALARAAAVSSLDDLGGCAFRSDLAALRHETLYSRLFRS